MTSGGSPEMRDPERPEADALEQGDLTVEPEGGQPASEVPEADALEQGDRR